MNAHITNSCTYRADARVTESYYLQSIDKDAQKVLNNI
jgi:hypothetical protein